MLDLASLRSSAEFIHERLPATPQLEWPLISRELGCSVFVKHENHLPTGAFKARGGVLYMEQLRKRNIQRVIAATRGNHGQSVAFAAQRLGMQCTIVVPHGNSKAKNQAMRGFDAELVEHGEDFIAAYEHMQKLAVETGAFAVPSFDEVLVEGIASYGLELFDEVKDLDAIYVPIGWGSGICGVMTARDALGLKTKIIGVVAEQANSFALSFAKGEVVETTMPNTMADGMAIRRPHPDGLAWAKRGVERVMQVSESEILTAIRMYFDLTHNVAEGAGAASLAAAIKDRAGSRFRRVAVVLSGGNIDASLYSRVLQASAV